MNPWIKAEYQRLRACGWTCSYALRAARVKDAWDDAENAGLVKVEYEPEFLAVEEFEPDWASLYPRKCDAERAQKDYHRQVERDGLWIIVTYYRLDSSVDDWEVADSCGGFVGSDWRDSGYDVDMREAALEALAKAQDEAASVGAEALAGRATYAGAVPQCKR